MYQFSKWVHATEDLKIANLLIQGVVFKLHVAVYLSVFVYQVGELTNSTV